MIQVKRIYDPPSKDDGERFLVERLWPRGLTREATHLSGWLKDLAPSSALRQWFGHDPQRWAEFRQCYEAELQTPEKLPLLQGLAKRSQNGAVTLVFAAKDVEHNSAVVLKAFVEGHYIKPDQ
ncbi:MAG: DUF488 domain-containing protein [Dehalococcoidia bacterium]